MLKDKRTISRTSFAYPFFPTALNACSMRIDPNEEFDEGVSAFQHPLSPGSGPPNVELRLRLRLADLARQAKLDPKSVRGAVVARSDELRRRRVLTEFASDNAPATWSGTIPEELMGCRRIEVDLICYLADQLDHSFERAWRRGSVFARRTWAIASPKYASLFTVTWVHFSTHEGWEANALWRVEFPEGERFHEVSSDSAVGVALNADLTTLHSLIELPARTAPTRAAKAIVTKTLFAEILSTIIHTVVEDYRRFHEKEGLTVDDLEEDRLTVRVLRFLDEHGVSEADVRSHRLRDLAAVTHFVQGAIDIGREFDLSAWERLSK